MLLPFMCLICSRFGFDEERVLQVCEAFPDGIPWAIVETAYDHRLPWPGDHAVRFKPAPEATPTQLAHLELTDEVDTSPEPPGTADSIGWVWARKEGEMRI